MNKITGGFKPPVALYISAADCKCITAPVKSRLLIDICLACANIIMHIAAEIENSSITIVNSIRNSTLFDLVFLITPHRL